MTIRNRNSKLVSTVHIGALMATLAALGACGGGTEESAPTVAAVPAPPPPAPAPVVPTFFGYGSTSGSSVGAASYVFDVSAATPLVLALPQSDSLYPSEARTTDPVAGTQSYLGAGQGTYVAGGKVYTVNLRQGQVPAAVQVSSITTACNLADQFEVAADGSDTWFLVDEAGPDGDCAAAADNRQAMVRTTGTATTAPTLLRVGVVMTQRLPNADNSLRWLLANDTAASPPKAVLFNPDMSPGPDVTNGAGDAQLFAVVGYGSALQFSYMRHGTALQRLTWDAAGASMSTSLYTFKEPRANVVSLGLSDASASYFIDGSAILSVNGTAQPMIVMPAIAAGTTLGWLRQSPTRLIAEQTDVTGAASLVSVAKTGGPATTLVGSASRLVGFGNWAVAGETVAYFLNTVSSRIGEWHKVGSDGAGDSVISPHVGRVGVVSASTSPIGQFFLSNTGVLYCDAGSAAVDCNGGTLVQYDLASGVRTTLGTLPVFAGATQVRGTANSREGAGAAFSVAATVAGASTRDLFVFKTGIANSLVRLTTNLP